MLQSVSHVSVVARAAATHRAAEAEDASVFDYDGVYDEMSRAKERQRERRQFLLLALAHAGELHARRAGQGRDADEQRAVQREAVRRRNRTRAAAVGRAGAAPQSRLARSVMLQLQGGWAAPPILSGHDGLRCGSRSARGRASCSSGSAAAAAARRRGASEARGAHVVRERESSCPCCRCNVVAKWSSWGTGLSS